MLIWEVCYLSCKILNIFFEIFNCLRKKNGYKYEVDFVLKLKYVL